MDAETIEKPVIATKRDVPRCSDFDDECVDVECHLTCWLYEPAKGFCPFLSTGSSDSE